MNHKSKKDENFKIERAKSSARHAVDGLVYAYTYEQSMFIHVFFTVLLFALGLLFKINLVSWIILAMALGITVVIELINTSIEATVDLITEEYHPIAKIAKDTGAAASLCTVIMDIIVGILIFVPKFIEAIF